MWRRSNQRFRTFLLNLFHVNSILTLILTGLRGSTALHLQSWGGRIARCVPRNKYASEKENLYAIYLREQRILTFQHNTHVGMEGARGGGTTSADGPELWSLNVKAHQLYIRRHLQRGLRMFCPASYAEEASITSSVRASADAVHVPFMELQQQQQSLLSGVYWTLCCLALLQPPAAVSPSSQEEHGPETTTLPLPPTVKECLISKVILPCLRRRQCSGWVSAAPDVVSAAMPAERGEGYGGSVAKEALSHRLGRPSPPTVAPTALGSGGHCRISALGFGSNLAGHATATALSTCSGLQALALLEALPLLSEGVLRQLRHFVLSLQRGEDGSFANTLSPICWSRWCSHCRETAAGAALPSAAAAMPSAAAANEEGTWENEGDVRCTFCCLLSLKLIHAAAKAHQKLGAASPPPQAGAVVAGAVDRAAEEASVSVTSAHSGAGDPAVCREGPTEPSPWLVQPTEGPLHGASWEAFLQDPFAGVRVDAMLSWLLSLVGPDGGVGVSPGAEPHAGAAFCFAGCVSLLGKWNALKIGEARRLERQDKHPLAAPLQLLLWERFCLVGWQHRRLLLCSVQNLNCCLLYAAAVLAAAGG